MKYQCDTARECGSNCGRQRHHGYHSGPVGCDQWYNCKHAGHRVRCNPIAPPPARSVCAAEKKHFQESLFGEMARRIYSPRPKTHTCYFCDHTGTDVNRIATYRGIRSTDYCCDDAVACDERWEVRDDEGESLRARVYEIISEEALNHMTNERIAIDATNRIMKLIELPF